MEDTKGNQSLESWVEDQLSRGRYTFSLTTLRESSPDQSDTATKFALKRMSDKGKLLSLYKGYYLIIAPQYTNRGILPPSLFLDAFMKFLQRQYYLALLNTASYHGASHQQPQEFFVVTDFPVLRVTQKKGMRINYISIKDIPTNLIEQMKTEAGYLNISSPALTATDLIHFINE
jgi:predicted transcriptional regulator of viral defense system